MTEQVISILGQVSDTREASESRKVDQMRRGVDGKRIESLSTVIGQESDYFLGRDLGR